MECLKILNKPQYEAVVNYKGAALVIAGAGSGKTRVLTYRIAYLLNQGVPAHNILSLTFTNKAAKEMKERISQEVGAATASRLWMGTFHSVFSRILRTEADLLGYPTNFTIYDSSDSKSLIKKIVKDLKLDDKVYKPNIVSGRISAAKNNLITAASYSGNSSLQAIDKSSRIPRVNEIYKLYEMRCKKAGAMDFDDLLLNMNILLRDHPETLKKYQNFFKYILVDEYQDTNYSQYLIVKKLSAKFGNLCVVGDDAQSIYAFRGARIQNILNFKNDYPDFKTYKLEQNYRSTQTIVDAANSIIAKNKNQIKKSVFSKNEVGESVTLIPARSDREEAFAVSSAINSQINENAYNYNDFAILYRTNAQSRAFEDAFRKMKMPYKIFGGLSFYQRKEVKDLLCYIRLTVNSQDDEALKRILNYPARGIGATTLGKLENAANGTNTSLWSVIEGLDTNNCGLNAGTINKIKTFQTLIKSFAKGRDSENAYVVAAYIAKESGMLAEFKSKDIPENASRLENMQELLNSIQEFSDESAGEGDVITLADYLQNVALITDMDSEKEEDKNKIGLMTVHASKGLEFKVVFVTGLEKNLFPGMQALSNPQDLEEERRLFYVAITRAEKKAYLSFAEERYVFGQLQPSSPSIFLNDIDEKYLDKPFGTIEDDPFKEKSANPFARNTGSPMRKKFNSTSAAPKKQTTNFEPRVKPGLKPVSRNFTGSGADMSKIIPGVQVEHERFGIGKVLNMEGEYPNTKATVFFKTVGQKQLLLKFAKLRMVD